MMGSSTKKETRARKPSSKKPSTNPRKGSEAAPRLVNLAQRGPRGNEFVWAGQGYWNGRRLESSTNALAA